MPIYEYRCDKGHTFDVMQSMSDAPLTNCQVCEAPVQKVLHAPAIHYKGSGFYSTDYGKKKTSGASKNGSSGDSGSSSGDSSGSSSSDSSSGSSDKAKPAASKSD
jgi:putative FmdB family regulatory protein